LARLRCAFSRAQDMWCDMIAHPAAAPLTSPSAPAPACTQKRARTAKRYTQPRVSRRHATAQRAASAGAHWHPSERGSILAPQRAGPHLQAGSEAFLVPGNVRVLVLPSPPICARGGAALSSASPTPAASQQQPTPSCRLPSVLRGRGESMLHAAQTHGREQGAGRRATHPASTAREAPASRCSAPPQPLRPSDRSSCQHDGRCAYKKQKNTEHEPTDIDIYIGCAKQKSVRRWREVPAGVGRVEVRSGKCACALSLLVGVHVRMHRRVSRRQHVCRCARLRVLCGKVRKGREEREGSRRSVRASEASLPAATAAGLRLARARERVQRSNARGGHASGPRARRPVNKKAAGLVHCRTRAVRVCPDSGVRDPSVPPAHALPRCPCSCPSAAHPLHQCEPRTRNQHTT